MGKGTYSYKGRTSDGRGLRWSDASESRERNRTFSDSPKSRPTRKDGGKRIQEAAAAIVDRNIARKIPDGCATTQAPSARALANVAADRLDRWAVVIREKVRNPEAAARLVVALREPGRANAKDRANLVRLLKREGLIAR